MNKAFEHFSSCEFEEGLAGLEKDSRWRDPRLDLAGPFSLCVPGAKGWGEQLMLASLIKRHACSSKTVTEVFVAESVRWILKHETGIRPQALVDSRNTRSPLAILRHALRGSLLNSPFVPIAVPAATSLPAVVQRPRIGVAWASISNEKVVLEKSVPVDNFLKAMNGLNADLVCLQRRLDIADPDNSRLRVSIAEFVDDEVLDAKTEANADELVSVIQQLDLLVTVSTTTTHLAAAMGKQVELMAMARSGHQWFWCAQAKCKRQIYPTVRVHLGTATKNDWWEGPLSEIERSNFAR